MAEDKAAKRKRLQEELAELGEEKEELEEEKEEIKEKSKETSSKEEKKELNRQEKIVAADAASVQTLIELSQALLKKLGATDEEIKDTRTKGRNRY